MKQLLQFANHNWQWMVTSAIAVYAAAISTYKVLASWKKDLRQIKVDVSWGALTYGERLSEPMIYLTAYNPGHRPVALMAAGFRIPNKKQLALLQPDGTAQLPYELREGKQCKHWISVREVAGRLRSIGFSGKLNLIGFYRDALDDLHLSEPFPIDLNEWR